MKIEHTKIPASSLPTALVICTLMLLAVLGIVSLWSGDFLFFSKANYTRNQLANLQSAVTLYGREEGLSAQWDEQRSLLLYDEDESSRVRYDTARWGLYELVTVSNHDGRMHRTALMGLETASTDTCIFYYSNRNFTLTLTGTTNLQGKIRVPETGIQFGQMESRFFDGEPILQSGIGRSGDSLPQPDETIAERVSEFMGGSGNRFHAETLWRDSFSRAFYRNDPLIFEMESGMLTGCYLSGCILLIADSLYVDGTCRMENILIRSRTLTIAPGFRGSFQAFVSGSVRVEDQVMLDYPSGIFVDNTAGVNSVSIGHNSEINGYIIVHDASGFLSEESVAVHYEQPVTAIVRGMLYVNGTAQLQGIVHGCAYLEKCVYKTAFATYDNLIHDASVLENEHYGYPFWLTADGRKKTLKWLP